MAGLGALLLAAACTGGGGASTTPTATATSATATPSPTAAATATPTATATPSASGAPPIVIEPSDALTVREFAPGERLDAEHGVFIADATTGAGELWAVNPDLVPSEFDLRSLQSSPDGRFVTARVVDTSFLADRTTGAGFRWDADAFRMVGFPGRRGPRAVRQRRRGVLVLRRRIPRLGGGVARVVAAERAARALPAARGAVLARRRQPLPAGGRARARPARDGGPVRRQPRERRDRGGRSAPREQRDAARAGRWLRGHRAGDAELRAAAHRGPALRPGTGCRLARSACSRPAGPARRSRPYSSPPTGGRSSGGSACHSASRSAQADGSTGRSSASPISRRARCGSAPFARR